MSANHSGWSRRDLLRRTGIGLGGIAAVGAAPALLSGCTKTGEGGTLQKAKDAKTIKIGIAGEKPYGYTENGKVTGEAPEVARAVFKAMGIDNVEAKEVEFGALITSLENETFDVIAAGMFIKKERCNTILFSEPDYCAQTAFLVRSDGPAANVKTFQDIAANSAIKLGTEGKGAVEYGYAIKSGVKESQVTPMAKVADALEALAAGRVHAFSLTRPALAVMLKENTKGNLKLTDPFFPEIDGKKQKGCGGYGFRKGDKELQEAFNKELKKLQNEGKLYEIVKDFGFTKEEVDAAKNETAQSLCGD